MRKGVKIWLLTATLLVLIGTVIFVGAMMAIGGDFAGLSTVEYETNDYVIEESYRDIRIVADTADVVLVPSEDEATRASCYEQTNIKHSVAVKDGALVIEVEDTRKWYEHIGIGFHSPKLTLSIPKGEYGALAVNLSTGDLEISKELHFESMDLSGSTGDVKNEASVSDFMRIQTSTGDIRVEQVFAASLEVSTTTGDVTVSKLSCVEDLTVRVTTGRVGLSDVACRNLHSVGDTGDLILRNVIAAESFSIERSTGDVRLDGCDAAEITVTTDTGDVKGSLLSEKVFIVNTDTGRKEVPKTVTGGRCEITTDTGDIIITVRE